MGYLDEYDKDEGFFPKIVKAIGLALLASGLLYSVYWLFFRNWREERRVEKFLALLQDQKYEQAYETWGCTDADPCPYYPYPEFLEDWGPESELGRVETFDLGRSYTQTSGVILELTVNGKPHENLFVNRDSRRIGFFPYSRE